MTATVDRTFYRCSRCEDVHRTVEQREDAEKAAVEAVREAHDLLRPREIRRLREDLRLTTEQVGDLLYGVPRSIVEGWERGRYVQNREVDAMLRRLHEREFLEERAARGGVTLPEPLPDDTGPDDTGDPGASDVNHAEAAGNVA